MGHTWAESYVGQLRQAVGHRRLIVPSIRAIIRNERGEVLFISRRGEDSWGMPAGGIEEDESIFMCMQREVEEETGLVVTKATPIALYSSPELVQTNRFGDEYQMFEFVFRVDEWKGQLITETDETVDARFFPADVLPNMEPYWKEHTQRVLEDLEQFTGVLLLK